MTGSSFGGGGGAAAPVPAAAFVFSGHGVENAAMTCRLLRESVQYRMYLEEASAALRPLLGVSLVDLIGSGDARLCRAPVAEPALFAVQYALARTLEGFALRPIALLGHGIGEFAAAVAAGALSLRDGAALAAAFGAASTARSGGEAGPLLPIEAMAGYAEAVTALPGAEPVVPYYSSARGRRLRGEPLDAAYWSEHAVAPTRFDSALAELISLDALDGLDVIVEIGPRPVLGEVLSTAAGANGPACRALCPSADTSERALMDELSVLTGLGRAVRDPVDRIVLEAVAEACDEPVRRIGFDHSLRSDLGFDSIMLMRLKFGLERRLPGLSELTLRDMLEHLVTPGAVAEFLRGRLAVGSAAR